LVEQIVDFALGFVICGLIGMAFLPVVSARARRLTLARMESRLPMTFDEIEADRDLLRARFAAENRALELKAAEARDGRVADAAELGRRAVALMRATEQLEQTTTLLNERNAQLARSLEFGEKTQAALDETRETLGRRQEELTALHGEFDKLAKERQQLDHRVQELDATLATTTGNLEDARARFAATEAARRELALQVEDLSGQKTAIGADLAEAERRAADFDARRARMLAKIAAERKRCEELEGANLALRRHLIARVPAAASNGGGSDAPAAGAETAEARAADALADQDESAANGAAVPLSAEQELLDLREAISRLGRQVARMDSVED
jgi:chromosome segregation ATPase